MSQTFIEEVGPRTNAKLLSLQTQIDAIISGLTGNMLVQKVSLTAAQIKTANSVPIVGVDIAGSPGKTLLCLAAYYVYTFVAAAFTSTTLSIFNDTATDPQAFTSAFLTSVANDSETFELSPGTGANSNVVTNKSLIIQADADSVVGDSTVDVYIFYLVQTP